MTGGESKAGRLLYCHCAYAKVIAADVKERVLEGLCQSGEAFDAVSDLCEMSARNDPALERIAAKGAMKIVACYPRAVRGLFRAARVSLSDEVEILNMREGSAEDIVGQALGVASERPPTLTGSRK